MGKQKGVSSGFKKKLAEHRCSLLTATECNDSIMPDFGMILTNAHDAVDDPKNAHAYINAARRCLIKFRVENNESHDR